MSRIVRRAQTFSKSPDQFIEGIYPTSVDFGGPHTLHSKGQFYTDTIGSLGAMLGENNLGGMFSLPYVREQELCELICNRTGMDIARFMCNGGDATFAAITYARAATKRSLILSVGYHGSGGHWSYCTPPAKGCVDSQILKFSDIEEVIPYISNNTAGVIIEPIELKYGEKEIMLLQALRARCDTFKVPLIFDEIITGGRFLNFSVSNWSGVKPDMICLGKALGGGYPLSILVGTESMMGDPDVFISYTFAGFPAAINKAIELISNLSDRRLQEFWDIAEEYKNKINALDYGAKLSGYPTRCTWVGDNLSIWLLWQVACQQQNILLGRAWFPRITWTRAFWEKLYTGIERSVDFIKCTNPVLVSEPKPTFREVRYDR